MKTIIAFDPEFQLLVDVDAKAHVIGSDFIFTEGPIWHPREHFLIFSDIPASTRYRWDGQRITEIMKPTNKGNGMAYDADLNLLVCEHSTSAVVRYSNGSREVLASHFEDRELNSPNDIVVARDGSIYFTDPTYGRMPVYGVEREPALDFRGVYRIPPDGKAIELVVPRTLFTQPNGLCFSPDEKLLYVNDTEQANIRVFDVENCELTNERVFSSGICDPSTPGRPDGMKCDARGNVWVTGPGGLWVYAKNGRHIGRVVLPEMCANFHWGGTDWRTLFITASTSVYALPVKVGAHAEPFML